MKCAVKSCNNIKGVGGKSFFQFPPDRRLSKIWQNFCQKKKEIKTALICMDHFNTNCIENELQFNMGYATRRKLKRGSIPTIISQVTTTFSEDKAENDCITASAITDVQAKNVGNASKKQRNHLQKEIEFLRKQNLLLRKKLGNSLKEIHKLKQASVQASRKYEYDLKIMEERFRKIESAKYNMECKLKTIFTDGQVNKMQTAVKEQKWTEDDIAQSITLLATSAKAYKLLYKKGFPLPGIQTLQEWARRIHISSGIIEPVLQVLSASTQMSSIQKLCVLSFGQIKIQRSYSYCTSTDSTLAPVNYVQVALLRGLMSKWVQPIFYDFDCKMTVGLLKYILRRTNSCGYTVAAIVYDLGGSNRKLYNELEVNEDKPWFLFNNEKIFVFADVPHLIRLQRNHFLDDGFIINRKLVNTDIIFELLRCTSSGLSITHKISTSHLKVSEVEGQNVKLAIQLFSHCNAEAITRAASLGYLNGKNWKECHQLFKMTNDWFDVMNSRVPRADTRSRCHAYGLDLDSQNEILGKMSEMVKNMRAIGKRGLLPYQRGIIQSINALKCMFPNLQSRFGIKYILTYHLNQDILENFFGVMRAKGDLYDHPDQQAFKYRLRAYILGLNEGNISSAANVTADDSLENISADVKLIDTISQPSLTGTIFNAIGIVPFEDSEVNEDQELECLQYDGLENIAEYICHKLQKEIIHLTARQGSEETYSWETHLSEGSLSKPSSEMMEYMAELYKIYNKMNVDGLLITNNFIKMHIERAKHVKCSENIKKLFFRAIMFFKIRELNKEISDYHFKKKRKMK